MKVLVFLILFLPPAAFAKVVKSPLIETFSLTLKVTGDMQGLYSLAGPINSTIESESDTAGSICSLSSLVRKIKLQEKIQLEIWPTFNCSVDGQKKQYKLHRIYLDLEKESQKKTLNILDKKFQKVFLEFTDLSLQKGK